jgi:methionyl-tRNA formyltransferase
MENVFSKSFVFTGNRDFVLKEMVNQDLKIIHIIVMKNSLLEKNVNAYGIDYTVVDSKNEFLSLLDYLKYDILISNGCKYIIPANAFKNKIKYVNIHPSYLPDLKGRDPIIASILYSRDCGATCHIMDEIVDNGDIISQIKIPYSEDLDANLLYQLAFIAEVQVFKLALERNFQIFSKQISNANDIYYSYNPADRIIDFSEDVNRIINRIKSFSNKSKGCFFKVNGIILRVYDASLLNNNFLIKYSQDFNNMQIIFVYEDTIIFKINTYVMKFTKLSGEILNIKPFDYVTGLSKSELDLGK